MPFPYSHHGRVAVPRGVSADEALEHLVDHLEDQGAEVHLVAPPRVTATVPLNAGLLRKRRSKQPMSSADKVDLEIVDTPNGVELRYRVSMLRTALLSIVILLGPALARSNALHRLPWYYIGGFWLVIVGLSYLVSMRRAKKFFTRAVTEPVAEPARDS